ncbi:hypothetical protein [Rhizobium binxianense]
MRKLPDLEAWAVFAQAAETGSFAHTGEAARDKAVHLLSKGKAMEGEASEQAVSPSGLIRVTAPMSFG